MKVVQVHNQYASGRGGEDAVVEGEFLALRAAGVDVVQYMVTNPQPAGLAAAVAASGDVFWSFRSARAFRAFLAREKPDVVHVHNIFSTLSPSILREARRSGALVVKTLHNYRIQCCGTALFRDGAICKRCWGKSQWRGGLLRCYHKSFLRSSLVAAANELHRIAGTYQRYVDRFVVVGGESMKALFLEAGLPAEKLWLKGNFLADTPVASTGERRREVLFVWALIEQKGLRLMLKAWQGFAGSGWTLRVVGDGPVRAELERDYASPEITFCGKRPRAEVLALMGEAAFVTVPSIWLEPFGMVVIEALACGTPVISTRLGAPAEIYEDGISGYSFDADPASLTALLKRLPAPGSAPWNALHLAARARYVQRYSSENGIVSLLDVYRAERPSPVAAG